MALRLAGAPTNYSLCTVDYDADPSCRSALCPTRITLSSAGSAGSSSLPPEPGADRPGPPTEGDRASPQAVREGTSAPPGSGVRTPRCPPRAGTSRTPLPFRGAREDRRTARPRRTLRPGYRGCSAAGAVGAPRLPRPRAVRHTRPGRTRAGRTSGRRRRPLLLRDGERLRSAVEALGAAIEGAASDGCSRNSPKGVQRERLALAAGAENLTQPLEADDDDGKPEMVSPHQGV